MAVGYSATSGSLSEQDFLISFSFGFHFEFPGVVDTGKPQETGDGQGAGDVLGGPDGKAGVAVEGDLSVREVIKSAGSAET
jgi:hypothetical protein